MGAGRGEEVGTNADTSFHPGGTSLTSLFLSSMRYCTEIRRIRRDGAGRRALIPPPHSHSCTAAQASSAPSSLCQKSAGINPLRHGRLTLLQLVHQFGLDDLNRLNSVSLFSFRHLTVIRTMQTYRHTPINSRELVRISPHSRLVPLLRLFQRHIRQQRTHGPLDPRQRSDNVVQDR